MSLVALTLLVVAPQTPPPVAASSTAETRRNFGNRAIVGEKGTVITFDVPYAGGTEQVALMIPDQPAVTLGSGAPLVVHFHSAGFNHVEFGFNPELLEEFAIRGWFLVSPTQEMTGGNTFRTYGNQEAKARTRAAMDFVLERFPIDRERIYGLGFSMGGGDVLSYAAQYADPERGAFAAIVQHTGTTSAENEYWQNQSAQIPLETALGSAPTTTEYLLAQVLDYESIPGQNYVHNLAGVNPIVNLEAVPVQSWFDLQQQNYAAWAHHQGELDELDLYLNEHVREERDGAANPATQGVPHTLRFIDPIDACDFLEQHTLQVPARGQLAAARDARYHDVHITRTDTSRLARIDYDLQAPGLFADRLIRFSRCWNVATLQVDGDAGTYPNRLQVDVRRDDDPQTTQPREIVVTLEGYGATPPTSVLLNGDVTLNGSHWAIQGEDLVLFPDHAQAVAVDTWRVNR